MLVASVGPRLLPYRTHHVDSGSMEPVIDVGDLVFLTRVDGADVRVGDVITFDRPDRPGTTVIHRIAAVEPSPDGRAFRTKGDANPVRDPWLVPAPRTAWRYAFRVPKLGYAFGALGSTLLRAALLAGAAALVVGTRRRR